MSPRGWSAPGAHVATRLGPGCHFFKIVYFVRQNAKIIKIIFLFSRAIRDGGEGGGGHCPTSRRLTKNRRRRRRRRRALTEKIREGGLFARGSSTSLAGPRILPLRGQPADCRSRDDRFGRGVGERMRAAPPDLVFLQNNYSHRQRAGSYPRRDNHLTTRFLSAPGGSK